MSELKPCPFCGGKAYLAIEDIFYTAMCEDCNAIVMADKDKELAIGNWNKRASDAEIERLKQRIIELESSKTKLSVGDEEMMQMCRGGKQ